MSKILIGIDPGVNTGFAVSVDGELKAVKSMRIDEAMPKLFGFVACYTSVYDQVIVYIEDARKRGCDPKTAAVKAQGAGSVKRDCKIWEDYLTAHKIPFVLVSPKNNKTKRTADQFKRKTGWQGRTNEHGRDAAMLIFGR